MSFFLSVPRRFHPGYSVLGRWLRTHAVDKRVGEARYYLLLALVVFGAVMAQNIAWAVLQPALAVDGDLRTIFWTGQALAAFLVGGLGLVGFRPAFTIQCDAHELAIEQAGQSWKIPIQQIQRVVVFPFLTYYRHYRAYALTVAFLDGAPDRVLVVETAGAPIVLGLPSPEREALVRLLGRPRVPAPMERIAPDPIAPAPAVAA